MVGARSGEEVIHPCGIVGIDGVAEIALRATGRDA
jgi:hypothetical protein